MATPRRPHRAGMLRAPCAEILWVKMGTLQQVLRRSSIDDVVVFAKAKGTTRVEVIGSGAGGLEPTLTFVSQTATLQSL